MRHRRTQRYTLRIRTRWTLEHGHRLSGNREFTNLPIEFEDFGVFWALGVECPCRDLGDTFEGEAEAPGADCIMGGDGLRPVSK